MPYKSILYNWKFRILLAILGGGIFKLLVDVIFGLLYKNYVVIKPLSTYLGVLFTTIVVVELYFLATKRFDKKLSWNDKPTNRFYKQFVVHTLIILAFFGPIRWFVEILTADSFFVVLQNEIIILASTLVIALLFNLFELGMFLSYKWRMSLAEIERFKKENAEFRFDMLRSQVNPHFLFNSLNTLSSLMYDNVDTAANYIRRLSEVYRYVLENRQRDLVTLDTELKFIDAYKYLFELRFTDRITFNIDIAVKAGQYFIAPMTLQMLVENAVKHNVISAKKPLSISIETNINSLCVTNNLQEKLAEGYSSGLGLKNIKSQYAYLTNRQVVIEKSEKEFKVEIPLIAKTEMHSND